MTRHFRGIPIVPVPGLDPNRVWLVVMNEKQATATYVRCVELIESGAYERLLAKLETAEERERGK